MAADSGDRRPVRVPGTMGSHPPPQLTEPLPCPRCDSNNTKFCYYNNYNLSQPRYFCKSCRRYWTHGGTLRNVPVGGGTRKASKRSRCPSGSSPSVATSSSSSSTSLTHEAESVPTGVNSVSVMSGPGVKPEMVVNLNESVDIPMNRGFTSFLNSQGEGTYLTLGEYGFGTGPGFDGVWGYPGNGYLGGFNGGDNGGGPGGAVAVGGTTGCNQWQATTDFEGDGDCFGWSGLAISAPGKGSK